MFVCLFVCRLDENRHSESEDTFKKLKTYNECARGHKPTTQSACKQKADMHAKTDRCKEVSKPHRANCLGRVGSSSKGQNWAIKFGQGSTKSAPNGAACSHHTEYFKGCIKRQQSVRFPRRFWMITNSRCTRLIRHTFGTKWTTTSCTQTHAVDAHSPQAWRDWKCCWADAKD